MIVVMKPGVEESHTQHVIELLRQMGLKEHVIVGTDRTVVAGIGDKRNVDMGAIENAPFVDRVVPILAPYVEYSGGTLSVAGIVLSAYGFAQILLRIPVGIASDRSGRRPKRRGILRRA